MQSPIWSLMSTARLRSCAARHEKACALKQGMMQELLTGRTRQSVREALV